MPRTAAFPLANLPLDTTALRLRTNQEIYWDQLHVINAEPQPVNARKVTAPLVSAELSAVGYPKPVKQPHHRPDYDYAARTPLFDFQHQTGLYTNFGPVEDLVESADQNIVTIGPGEGITMSFEYPKGIDPETLHWVVDFHGWCKDRDRFTKTGRTLEPLPGNTPRANRMESGR